MPFFETALFGEDNLTHIASVRYRVTGQGNLQSVLYTLDEIRSAQLSDINMQITTNREPAILANFFTQKMKLKVFTDQIDEIFHVTRTILFTKPIYTGRAQ